MIDKESLINHIKYTVSEIHENNERYNNEWTASGFGIFSLELLLKRINRGDFDRGTI